jgi:hypothetical protein
VEEMKVKATTTGINSIDNTNSTLNRTTTDTTNSISTTTVTITGITNTGTKVYATNFSDTSTNIKDFVGENYKEDGFFTQSEIKKIYLQDTIGILAEYDGCDTVASLKALVDETRERLIKLSSGKVELEDIGYEV